MPANDKEPGLKRLTVSGFKSIATEQSIEFRPLTILAGANSSGKSSMMQPLLLLKQTLEAPYDPGAMLLDGPNVRFSAANDFLTRCSRHDGESQLDVEIAFGSLGDTVHLQFAARPDHAVEAIELRESHALGALIFRPSMTGHDVTSQFASAEAYTLSEMESLFPNAVWEIARDRFFLRPARVELDGTRHPVTILGQEIVRHLLTRLIHVPGFRGNPERLFPVTSSHSAMGTFDQYVASRIERWQSHDAGKLQGLLQDLQSLDLTSAIRAQRTNGAALEIQVDRVPKTSGVPAPDFVNLADVGLGMSHVLPVIVALHAADRYDVVYIEQPEIHLHPKAQVALGGVLARAAGRGVRVVIETHSNLLLLAIQSMVAEGELADDDVALHWFTRLAADGSTSIATAELDEAGRFGDWPADFGEVELEAQSRYLDAAAARIAKD